MKTQRALSIPLWGLAAGCLAAALINSSQAADVTVMNLDNDGAGSLRQALRDVPTGGSIDFDSALPAGTINLLGGMVINKNVTIIGPGTDRVFINGQDTHRIFFITAVASVSISGLTFQNGRAGGTIATGGAIDSDALSLTLSNCVFIGNQAVGTFASGGAVHSDVPSTITVDSCLFSDNEAIGTASGSGNGGAIHLAGNPGPPSYPIKIKNSTFSLNRAEGGQAIGGALYLYIPTAVTLENCTISGNTAHRSGGTPPAAFAKGGGVFALCGDLLLGLVGMTNCTVADNAVTVTGTPAASDAGGGLAAEAYGINLLNTLVANNMAAGDAEMADVLIDSTSFMISHGHNLLRIAPSGSSFLPSDLTGTTAIPLDPKVGLLANNGGLTLTHALQSDSPAKDAANTAAAPATDQRGFARSGEADIGAFEYQPPSGDLTITCPGTATFTAGACPTPFVATVGYTQLGNPGVSWDSGYTLTRTLLPAGGTVTDPYVFPQGTHTVRYTVTDNTNPANTNYCDQSVTVNPPVNQSPVRNLAVPTLSLTGYWDRPFPDTVLPANYFTNAETCQTITYSASGMPPGISFTAATRTFSGTPTPAGAYAEYTVTVTATDDFPGTPGTANATFTFRVYPVVTLTVSGPPVNGKITAPPTLLSPALDCGAGGTGACVQEYPLTDPPVEVVLTAVGDGSHTLSAWGGDAVPGFPLPPHQAKVLMNGNKTVSATFVPKRTLNLTITGGPGYVYAELPVWPISGPSSWDDADECSKSYAPEFLDGQTVTLKRTVQAGAAWAGWILDGGAVDMNDTLVVNMTANHGVTATFQPDAPRVQITGSPSSTPVLAGAPVNGGFTVATPGLTVGTPTFQWFKEAGEVDTEVSGQNTATFTFIPTSAADEGQYYLRVTNQCGETLSSPLWTLTLARDFGDAPHTPPATQFPTLLANDGARHIRWADVPGSLRLGVLIDSETDGQTEQFAFGDDSTASGGMDDEDGVIFSPVYLAISRIGSAVVSANKFASAAGSAAGKLDAWIDFNGDGIWLDSERITDPSGTSLNTGNNNVPYTVPVTAGPGQRIARFRISSAGGLSPTGDAPVGEVEDHLVNIKQSPIVGLPPVITLPVNAAHSAVYLPLTVDGGWAVITPISTTPASPAIFLDPPSYIAPAFPNPGYLRLAPAGGQFGFATVLFQVNSGATFTHPLAVRIRNAPDTDEIPAAVEDNIPLPGGGTTNDGNGDGTPDSQQLYVASLPASEGTYLTLSGPATIRLTDVSIVPPSGSLPGEFPFGLLKFNVEGVPVGGSVQLTLKVHGTIPAGAKYYKHGKAARGDSMDSYYEFTYDPPTSPTGAAINFGANEITLHLTDGALGDGDWTANGLILDPGGPLLLTPPSLSIVLLPGNQALISWPASASGAVLKYAESLTVPVTWNNDTNTVTTAAGTNSVTVDLAPGPRFYRLGPP